MKGVPAVAAACLMPVCALWAQGTGETRRALLIGNSAYKAMAPLATAGTDVRLLARVTEKLRFETRVVENANLDQLDQAIQEFTKKVQRGDVALVYLGGYGVQVQGENYLLGVEFDPRQGQEIDYSAYSLRRALSELEARDARLTAILLDVAYDEPALRRRYAQPGLAPMTPSRQGTLIGLSAAPQQSALPSSEKVSLYARALMESMPAQGQDLSEVFAEVKRKVNFASGGRQVPVEMSTVVTEFRLNPKPEDELAWERIGASTDDATLREFLKQYPNSAHATEAKARLAVPASPAPSAAAPPKTAPDDRTLAEQALRDYRQAFEGRDAEALKAVWPSLGSAELERIQQFFRSARAIRLKLEPEGAPVVNGGVLTWVCHRTLEVTMERGSMPVQRNRVTMRMKRDGSRMTIESMAVGQ